ncbi:MAG: pitrilysin family protein [Evtepia sp.]|uniref:EF-P 5-aminopentanol modification-associated protein YfmH n=1 Tax=Evtepia sp. TaxID=2773933 RepID=UPI002A759493|nr:pitrilysin family protein [Evtepia sp.]MDY3013835.1 pitrilysin family protein [Evtepia sp.]
MVKHTYETLGETLFEETLENGLRVYVFPKPEFGKCFAFFATRYGGMDTRFQLGGQWLDTPMGIAHYLEHKMFDTPDGNALQKLSATGASPNAFTSTAITGYHFECTDRFYENLRILLEFVSVPYFTEESVEKEQGIIGQEIRMIEDNPSWQVYHMLLEALYQHHPVRNSVAGSVESIREITAQTLYHCHEAFYTPSNMVLCVAGNVDPEQVCAMAREILPKEKKTPIPRDCGQQEPEEVFQRETSREMAVSAPLVQLGIKVQPAQDGAAQFRQRLLGDLACEAWAGHSSPLYRRLYEEGLIDSNFYLGYMDYPGCAFLVADGECKEPEKLRDILLEEGARLGREGIDEGLFRRLKKAAYGNYVRALNSFETLCVEQAKGYFSDQAPWSFPEVYETITRQDAEAFLRRWIRPEQAALAVIRPGGKAQ